MPRRIGAAPITFGHWFFATFNAWFTADCEQTYSIAQRCADSMCTLPARRTRFSFAFVSELETSRWISAARSVLDRLKSDVHNRSGSFVSKQTSKELGASVLPQSHLIIDELLHAVLGSPLYKRIPSTSDIGAALIILMACLLAKLD